MGCFLIPYTSIERFHQLLGDFWLGRRNEDQKTHWLTWERLCQPKAEGGLGFRHLHVFHLALLARLWWRFYQNPDLLLSQIYKGQYHHTHSLLVAELGYRPSWGWRSLLAGRNLLLPGLR
ncbi:Uncharacterized mitochondrial protein AtMg00310 [Linum grandiflorum]